MNKILKCINKLLSLCKAIENDISLSNDHKIRSGNENYKLFKVDIKNFIENHKIKDKYPLQYSAINKYYYVSTTWTLNIEELDTIKSALIELKSFLCKGQKNKIFISHCEKDEKQVAFFIELLHSIGLPLPTNIDEEKVIFCSSHPAYYIDNGDHNKAKVKEELSIDKTDTFYILWYSDNYFKSSCCLNEMGAIWICNKEYQEVLEPSFNSEKIKGLLDTQKVWFRLEDKFRLNDFKNQIVEMFSLDMPQDNYWEKTRDKFIEQLKSLLGEQK